MNIWSPLVASSISFALSFGALGAREISHPAIRLPVAKSDRPAAEGSCLYVDPVDGSDANPGSEEKPWKTIQASLSKLRPGDTLYLAGGLYFENLYCAIIGKPDQPITIRSKPGELAIIDGGLPEFELDPANAWEPFPKGGEGEYRSKRTFPNIRDVVGLFGDSNIGLQTYWHPEDLRSTKEVADGDEMKQHYGRDVTYCGPGIWYNRETAHIHVRLAHTNYKHPLIANYEGETDPRKLPLVIAPYNSVPLHVDLATHVRFQDLVFRGGGLDNVKMHYGRDVEFDHVTIFGGTYGLRSKNSGPVKFLHSAIYGGIPPWAFYAENGLHAATSISDELYAAGSAPESSRDVARLTNHALLVLGGFEESDVFAYPFNNRWEIAYSEFADGHDGVYPTGINIRMHDNWIGNMQDDAIYLSSPTRWVCDDIHIYRNYITGCTSAFAFHGRGGPEGSIFIYGNVVDARFEGTGRWRTTSLSEIKPYANNFFLVHGSGKMINIESLYFYHNTAILPGDEPSFLGSAYGGAKPGSTRHVANNLFVYLGGYPLARGPRPTDAELDLWVDGNVHWSAGAETPPDWLKTARSAGADNPAGWEIHSVVGSPAFLAFDENRKAVNDYRIGQGAATDAALPLPKEITLEGDVGGSDVGAFQTGAKPLKVGVDGRLPVGTASQ